MSSVKKLTLAILVTLFSACGSSDTDDGSTTDKTQADPVIISINPSSGTVSTPVTITGTGFGDNRANVEVRFNNVLTDQITFSSSTQISTMVPTGATTGAVSVKIGTKEAIGPDFTVREVVQVPEIAGVSVSRGLEGTMITITGTNFSADAALLNVSFNGTSASNITAASTTEISVQVPIGAATGPLSVTVGSQTVSGPNFTVETPENFKIAFFGDTHIGDNADAVLELVKNEGAQMVIHPGDLNYSEVPADFESNIDLILGPDFPYFYSVGNHDDEVWEGAQGYQALLEARFRRVAIPWKGRAGVESSFSYQGITFVSSAPDELETSPEVAGSHVSEALGNSESIWRVSYWHKNQRLMQIGGKNNEAGWGVYEESRKGGALIATGHEHSYSRTYEMSDFSNQTVSNTDNTVHLIKDDPATQGIDEGRSFAFVSGLGGRGIRDAEDNLDAKPWWADVYHSGNGGQYGALFGEFNYNGDASLARFYFKDIDGNVRDEFFVRSDN